jgi:hypothetical protein
MPTMRAKLHTRAVFLGQAVIGVLVVAAAIGLGGQRAGAQAPVTQPVLAAPAKRVHRMSEVEFSQYVVRLHQAIPTPGERIGHVAMRSIGQPYRLAAPMFSLRESDCVTFMERTLAAALSPDWETYYRITNRLRHKDGQVGVLERNYFTLSQWVPNNAWLLTDITEQLGPTSAFIQVVRPKAFYRKLSFGDDASPAGQAKAAAKAAIVEAVPEETRTPDVFIESKDVLALVGQLRTGDIILIIREYQPPDAETTLDCNHMGILVERTPWDGVDPDGPPSIVHSVPPKVRRESLVRFLRRFPQIKGIKVLRIRDDAASATVHEDTLMATRITVPAPRPE